VDSRTFSLRSSPELFAERPRPGGRQSRSYPFVLRVGELRVEAAAKEFAHDEVFTGVAGRDAGFLFSSGQNAHAVSKKAKT
jgi:hypothetical protein